MKKIKNRVLVLGAYGLIGSEIFRRLRAEDHVVIPFGRDEAAAKRVLPDGDWVIRDITRLTNTEDWDEILRDIDFVVNCTGALQANRFDNLSNLHHHAVAVLAQACAKWSIGLVQISAVGAARDAKTEFLASKGRGDDCIRDRLDRYWIFKPGLVLSYTAYGGTQLIRMIAAVPFFQPMAFGSAKVQTVSVEDVALAVVMAVEGELPEGLESDLLETDVHSLRDIILSFRKWLGFPKPKFHVNVPSYFVRFGSNVADGLGRLGWRSPLRSTSTAVLEAGILGTYNPKILEHTKSLDETLASFSATAEDRLSARMALLMPVIVGLLSLFWIASGLIGFFRVNVAAEVLVGVGWPYLLASASVLFWAIVDIVLGCGILVRRYAKRAALGMIFVSVLYLVFSSVFVPSLWLDPLGPLVKILPSIGLAMVARSLLESR